MAAIDDVYRFVTRKMAGDASGEDWVNVWDVWYPAGVTPTASDAIVNALATFEQHVHNNDVYIEDLTVYHWGAPGAPARPPLFTHSIHILGDNATHTTGHWVGTGNPAAGSVTIGLRLLRMGGLRDGRKRFRGSLRVGDITTVSAMTNWVYTDAGGSGTIPAAVDGLFTTYLGAFSAISAPGPDPILGNVHKFTAVGIGAAYVPYGINGASTYTVPLNLQIKR